MRRRAADGSCVVPRELILSDVERRVALRGLGGMAALPAEALAALARLGRRRTLAAGGTLTAVGVPLLLEGEWRLAADAVGERPEQRVELAWLTGAAMPALTTATGAVVLELPRERLDDALDEHFAAWLATTRAIAGRLLDRGLADGAGGALGGARPGGSEAGALGDGHEGDAPSLGARLLALGRALPFARAHVDALLQLDEAAVEVALAPGVPAWRAGDPAHSLLVPLADDAPAALVGVGGVALLAHRPHAERLVPTVPVRALRVDAEHLLDVIEDHHRLARDLLSALAAALLRLG
jgi:hypothetical protein